MRRIWQLLGHPAVNLGTTGVEGDWEALVELYRARIEAPSITDDLSQKGPLLFRLGQILEERILDLEQAAEVYWTLARIDPTLGSEVVEVADGLLVLGGPGTYINAAVACRRTAPLTEADWVTIVEHSAAVGVTPAIELSATTHPGTVAGAAEHGFELVTTRTAYLLVLGGVPPPPELVDAHVDDEWSLFFVLSD